MSEYYNIKAVLLYCCPGCTSCLANAIQMARQHGQLGSNKEIQQQQQQQQQQQKWEDLLLVKMLLLCTY